jgi:hypothetical protein
MSGRDIAKVVVVLVAGAVVVGVWRVGLIFGAAREEARRTSCQSNIHAWQTALTMYIQDWDERMPLRPSAGGDFIAARGRLSPNQWGKLMPDPPGPLFTYVKNGGLCCCPSDPEIRRADGRHGARPSYEWNLDLCGKRYEDAVGKPVVWDRRPWHRAGEWREAGRNVAFIARPDRTGASRTGVRWVEESEFQAMRR